MRIAFYIGMYYILHARPSEEDRDVRAHAYIQIHFCTKKGNTLPSVPVNLFNQPTEAATPHTMLTRYILKGTLSFNNPGLIRDAFRLIQIVFQTGTNIISLDQALENLNVVTSDLEG